jgi:hypothetical protein
MPRIRSVSFVARYSPTPRRVSPGK